MNIAEKLKDAPKFRLTDNIKMVNAHMLRQIEAIKDFADVKAGDLGGYVEIESNLSQDDNAWVYDDAQVYDNARVYGDARVYDNARVCDDARVYDNARVCDDAQVCGDARVYDNARVCSDAWVYDNAWVYGFAQVCGNARVYGDARVYDNARVYGYAYIQGDAQIRAKEDYIVFKNWWSSGRYFTWTRSNNMWSVGCFYGSGKDLVAKAYKDSDLSGQEYERIANYVDNILIVKN